ncbi:MAG: efflux RND transporter periplasmic adaptor subunit [Terriglobales bacterium]
MSRFAKFVVLHRAASALALLLVIAGVLGVAHLMRADTRLPTAEVKRGEFIENLPIRGEIKAARSMVLNAPSGVGQVQIIYMAKTGDPVKEGDVVVRFDTTALQNQLDTRASELKQAEREIDGAIAQAHMTEEQDATDLAKAKFDVERARLDASKQEILSQIDGEKAKLALADAEQSLREAQQKQTSNKAADAAIVASSRLKENKALFDVNLAKSNIAKMEMKAPVSGVATILTHWMGPNQQVEWRTGDNVWPGAGVMELPDMNTIQVAARVDEIDRGRLQVGQRVHVRVDAVPDTDYSGVISEISPMAKSDFSGWPIVRNFDIRMKLDAPDNRLKPGMSASARIAVDSIKDAIMIPVESSFQKSGRTVAYVVHGSAFEERVIEIARRSGDQLAVAKGLKPGERVYTKDPTVQEAGAQ